jgi:pyruvate carboxylase subunit B
MKYITSVNEQEYVIEIDQDNRIVVNGEPLEIDFQQLVPGGPVSLLINNRSLEAIVDELDDAWEVLLDGELYTVSVQDERAYRLSQARGQLRDESEAVVIRSPMPGLILDVLVQEGDVVAEDDKVVILESMKMENELRAARDGVVTRVFVSPGTSVEKNQQLVAIGDAADEDEYA